jgi:addiction module HigA family antidote
VVVVSYRPELLTHPGEIIQEHMEAKSLTVVEVSRRASIAPSALERILEGMRSIMPREAYGLARALGKTPDFWKNLQQNYDDDIQRLTYAYPCPHPACDGALKTPPTIATGEQVDCICKACVLERTSTGLKFVRMGRL